MFSLVFLASQNQKFILRKRSLAQEYQISKTFSQPIVFMWFVWYCKNISHQKSYFCRNVIYIKRLKTLSKVENIPLAFYYNEPVLHGFLRLHPVKHALPSFSANHHSALEERCQNFGFSLIPTLPVEGNPVSLSLWLLQYQIAS